MRAPERDPARTLNLGRYAVAGILALALSLAGVMGGHHLLGAAFGLPDGDEAFALAREEGAECPPDLRARDACDYDAETAPPDADRGDEDSCGAVGDPGAPVARGRRPAAATPPLLAERR